MMSMIVIIRNTLNASGSEGWLKSSVLSGERIQNKRRTGMQPPKIAVEEERLQSILSFVPICVTATNDAAASAPHIMEIGGL